MMPSFKVPLGANLASSNLEARALQELIRIYTRAIVNVVHMVIYVLCLYR